MKTCSYINFFHISSFGRHGISLNSDSGVTDMLLRYSTSSIFLVLETWDECVTEMLLKYFIRFATSSLMHSSTP